MEIKGKNTQKVKTGELIRRFKADTKAVRRLNIMVSAAYLLIHVANDYIEDANDELQMHGVNIHEIKQFFGVYKTAFNNFHRHMYNMIETEQGKTDLLNDFDKLRKIVDCFVMGEETKQQELEKIVNKGKEGDL